MTKLSTKPNSHCLPVKVGQFSTDCLVEKSPIRLYCDGPGEGLGGLMFVVRHVEGISLRGTRMPVV